MEGLSFNGTLFVLFLSLVAAKVSISQGFALSRYCLRQAPARSMRMSTRGNEDRDKKQDDALNYPLGFSSNEHRGDGLLLNQAIDSFLCGGDCGRSSFSATATYATIAPHPGMSPGATVEAALRALRVANEPEDCHGAVVLMSFCVPLSRGERWGRVGDSSWREVMRGSITPALLVRRIRTSEFSGLLDWTKLDVTEGAYHYSRSQKNYADAPRIAYVNVALYFGDGIEPSLVQFTLRRIGGVWLIDSARRSKKELFVENS